LLLKAKHAWLSESNLPDDTICEYDITILQYQCSNRMCCLGFTNEPEEVPGKYGLPLSDERNGRIKGSQDVKNISADNDIIIDLPILEEPYVSHQSCFLVLD
jgi:hypothetical protein